MALKLPKDYKSYTIIDATNHILGRLASVVAKRLLMGEKIIIVNAEKAIIVGKRKAIIDKYKRRLQIKTHYNPEKTGPKHPKRPDRIVKRTIRGMLPYKTSRGREAFKRLRVYIGVPDELKDLPKETIPIAQLKNPRVKYVTVEEVAREIGWSS